MSMPTASLKELIHQPSSGTIAASIGNTPLIRLRNIARDLPAGVEVLAKAEHLNPGGSVKDRPALWMILAGERSGRLRRGQTILDATSGNTGIAYGMIGAALGYPVTICLPKNASRQRKEILRRFGVQLIETDPLLSTDGAQWVARELAASDPGKFFYADQYNNPANWRAHYESTAERFGHRPRPSHAFHCGLGNLGHVCGNCAQTQELKSSIRAIRCNLIRLFMDSKG